MKRIFTPKDQLNFARLSGDYNPIHVDAVAARRFMFGRPVVHGIHLVIWALDCFLSSHEPMGMTIEKLKVAFRNPVIVDEPVELDIRPAKNGCFRIDLVTNGVKNATINLSLIPAGDSLSISDEWPQKQPCVKRSAAEVSSVAGVLPLCLKHLSAMELFPYATRFISAGQLAMLLATTRLVGMELPGLNSLYTGLDLALIDDSSSALTYKVESFDDRFSLLTIGINGGRLKGTVSAALRPSPQNQASFMALQSRAIRNEFSGMRALVIGGSRGLGEVAVKALVAGGAEVKFTYHRGIIDAEQVASDITSGGAMVKYFAYDVLSDGSELVNQIQGWSPTLLCYFATPFIFSAMAGEFSTDLFRLFCDVYVLGFERVLKAISSGPVDVINPSSSALDELPSNMSEYTAAKAAAEMHCAGLAKARPNDVFMCPRLPRLPTDQTASLLSVDVADPVTIILEILRSIRKRRQQ